MFVIKGFGDPYESALVRFPVSQASNGPGCVSLEYKIEYDKYHRMGRKIISRDNRAPRWLVGGKRGREGVSLSCLPDFPLCKSRLPQSKSHPDLRS